MKRKGSVMMVVVLLLVMVTPAFAITFGTLDGSDHPNVGSMVLRVPDGSLYQWCSGTLIEDQVFLTASHCTYGVDEYLAAHPGYELLITFDPTIMASSQFYTVSEWVTNPAFVEQRYGASDTGDVAVALLEAAPVGITPARLPSAGLLDQLKDEHVLKDTLFTAVGYGATRDTIRTGFQGIQYDNMDRRQVEQGFLSLIGAWITLSMNPSTGNGGTCYGDSGGPHFIHLDSQETDIVAAVTVTGDAPCKATDKVYRLDTPAAREFLGQYVSLP